MNAVQIKLDAFRQEIVAWYMLDKLSASIIGNRLETLGLTVTQGQIQYAIHRFGLVRERQVRTPQLVEAVRNRSLKDKCCKHCKKNFKLNSSSQLYCDECVSTSSDIRRIKNYGICHSEFRDKLISQDFLCEICKSAFDVNSAAVDHDHNSGRIRGLLCRNCNLKLAVVEDRDFVLNAQAYLVKWANL
jgi:hypothetical protein